MGKDELEKVHFERWFNQGHLLKAIRGKRTQAELNNELRFSFNKISRWERNQFKLSWKDFVSICRSCNRDFDETLRFHLSTTGRSERFGDLLTQIAGTTDVVRLEKITSLKQRRLQRLLAGSADATLAEAFWLFERVHGVGKALYLSLAGCESLVDPEVQLAAARRQLVAKHPVVLAICALTWHEEYVRKTEHSPGFFAERLGLDKKLEQQLLDQLVEVRELTFDGIKYQPNMEVREEATSPMSYQDHANIISYWLHKANDLVKRLDDYNSQAMIAGYRVIAVDAASADRIEEKLINYSNEIGAIIRECDSPKRDRVCVIGFQMFNPTSVQTTN